MYNAISTRQAIRTVLNYERATIERSEKKGRIDGTEAAKLLSSLEERNKRLLHTPPEVGKTGGNMFGRVAHNREQYPDNF